MVQTFDSHPSQVWPFPQGLQFEFEQTFVCAEARGGRARTLRRTNPSAVDVTRFESYDAVRAFAGEDYEQAVIEPEARALLSRHDERSEHFEVAVGS